MSYEHLTLEDVNYYEEYLGTREEQERAQSADAPTHPDVPKRGPGRSSAIVCNHVGFLEIINMVLTREHPSFTPKSQVKTIPIAAGIAVGLQSMFIERGGGQNERDRIVEALGDR